MKGLDGMVVSKRIWRYEEAKCMGENKEERLPNGANLLGSKRVFQEGKEWHLFCGLVANGYNHILGVHFTENFAPLIKDVTMRTMLTELFRNEGWTGYIMDVATAFLYGEKGVNLFMEVPKGLEHFEDVNPSEICLRLKRTI